MIARRHSKVAVGDGIVEQLQLAEESVSQVRRNLLGRDVLLKEILKPRVVPTLNHDDTRVPPGGTSGLPIHPCRRSSEFAGTAAAPACSPSSPSLLPPSQSLRSGMAPW